VAWLMLGVTHVLFGLLVGTAFAAWFGNNELFLLFAALGALFPDIDHPKSLLGRWVKPVSYFSKHRGFFHSVLGGVFFTVLLDVFLRLIEQHNTNYPLVFFLGYLSHLLLDGSTKQGIFALWPTNIKFKGKRRVGSWYEKLLQAMIVLLLIWFWV
jgi:inner membrane protein